MSQLEKTNNKGGRAASVHILPQRHPFEARFALAELRELRRPLEQPLRVMYISHVWIATDLPLLESQSKGGRDRGQTAKRSFRGLQRPARDGPRRVPAG